MNNPQPVNICSTVISHPAVCISFRAQAHRVEPVMSRSVTLVKGKNNMIGISIGGGAPMCPVLYVVQVMRHCLEDPLRVHVLRISRMHS